MIDTLQTSMIAAFAAGTISFLSPCVLPLVPGYVSYIAGQSFDSVRAAGTPILRLQTIALSLCFILGFSTIFIVLGASASAIGQLLLAYRYGLNIAGGVIVIVFGLVTIGVLRPWWLVRDLRIATPPPRWRPLAAYVLGIAFALGWSPCIGPILGAILTVGAATTTVNKGIVLLATYSLGLGVPFLFAATFTDGFVTRLKSIGRASRACQMLAGSVMIMMGVAMITGQLSAFSYWLLDTFPQLSAIG